MELELQEYWQRKLWWLAEAKPILYFNSQDLTNFWWIKLWRIGNEPPNPHQSFLPPKFCVIWYLIYRTVYYLILLLPSASLLPGHFCLAVVDALVAGHVIFHTSSCSREHPSKV